MAAGYHRVYVFKPANEIEAGIAAAEQQAEIEYRSEIETFNKQGGCTQLLQPPYIRILAGAVLTGSILTLIL